MKKGFLTVPIAIIIAGAIIAVAIVYSTGRKAVPPTDDGAAAAAESGSVDKIKAVSSKDHLLGDPKAPVKLVEFSDTECPFCKRFHDTMHQVVNEYGDKVAWIYRHFPLDQLHSKARKEAEATECANELGGNEKFWVYIDRLFEITPSNNGLDLAELPRIAEFVGLDRVKFEQCLNSGKYADRVRADLEDATNSGGSGTPYSIVIAPNGQKFVVSGAQPLAAVKQVIDAALKLK
ncbi:MAG: hypothetical protein A2745_03560 [Candidatus Harrisonbacteria bacterium RIFCSPHIGHO2_01_FULL_44_13]|uniref:Thioredoxin domain-containing protein n=1 Tax=Candidatus Harrisonbacteria bacterium RIFCSPLOWO2_01_FULL_44_18 TaxID=1798407 RepID=A0A1G1ZKZ9_9BACT|nr:MAG: hypothetical protein A2745_03560 [Candidatus Harrisonbacteria bacterium RIFCSPHIGHO2_01_FULL_44_13]OGY65262.1 MAG: hypothetical protein A3A16_01925 [Candidatus Harrisonbacteria bacterium RIFCSPLOWO2_01_FULL_44_18]